MSRLQWNGKTIQIGGQSLDFPSTPETFDDWFLPSSDELEQMYINLHLEGVGGFDSTTYWASTEGSQYNGIVVNFSNGGNFHNTKQTLNNVRACRSFTDTSGAYNLRDIGPAGGLIFYIDGGTIYYEAAPSDQSPGIYWSNITNVYITTTGTSIGTGQQNTLDIIGQVGHTNSAAKLCNDLVI